MDLIGNAGRRRPVQSEGVPHIRFVRFSPEMMISPTHYQLRRDANAAGGSKHRTTDNILHTQLPCHIRKRSFGAFEPEYGGTRDYPKTV